MMSDSNIQTCDITDDDWLYKLVFKHYLFWPYKKLMCSKLKFCEKNSVQNYVELQFTNFGQANAFF